MVNVATICGVAGDSWQHDVEGKNVDVSTALLIRHVKCFQGWVFFLCSGVLLPLPLTPCSLLSFSSFLEPTVTPLVHHVIGLMIREKITNSGSQTSCAFVGLDSQVFPRPFHFPDKYKVFLGSK